MLAAGPNDGIAAPVLMIVFLMGSVIYMVGFRHARWYQARNAYRNTKAAVKPLRAGKWAAWRRMAAVGFWVALGFVLLVAWAYRDARNG